MSYQLTPEGEGKSNEILNEIDHEIQNLRWSIEKLQAAIRTPDNLDDAIATAGYVTAEIASWIEKLEDITETEKENA